VFPRLVGEGLYARVTNGYWLDIGTPERDLTASFDILESTGSPAVGDRMGDGFLCVEDDVENAGRIIPPALVESGCRLGPNVRVGGRAVLEHGVVVGADTTIEQAVVMRGAEIGANCTLRNCVVSGGVRIGDHCVVDGLSVLGEGVTIGAGNVVSNGARLFPGLTLPDGALQF
jgi:mannose-1-phosphate guanylyltransferase